MEMKFMPKINTWMKFIVASNGDQVPTVQETYAKKKDLSEYCPQRANGEPYYVNNKYAKKIKW